MGDERKVTIDAAEPPRIVRDLDLGQRIGVGGMGFVNEAFDRTLRRTLAVKSLRDDVDLAGHARERFIEEAQIASQLDHPNVIPVHDLARDEGGGLCFTMKLVEGVTLSEILAGTPLDQRSSAELFDLLQILLKVCDAVAFAHSRGVIHRDLKPDNVMVGSFGEVYLVDWGVAKIAGRRFDVDAAEARGSAYRTDVGTAVGTLNYMAPEQAAGMLDDVDERSDIFALGAILYEILTHRPPHTGDGVIEVLDAACRCEIVPPQQVVGAALPSILCKIALKAMAAKPEHRYQDVAAFKIDLEKFLRSGWQFPVRRYEPGEVIVREGSVGETAYAIVEGRCRVTREVEGVEREMRELGPGDVFGETAVFSEQRRSATVAAVEAVTAMEISREQFREDLGMGYWMGLFVRALAERFAEKEQRVLELEAELQRR